MSRVIVIGNEKGGCGKSTVAMHVVALLLRSGCGVGVLDLDPRQRSMHRFLENRRAFADRRQTELLMPEFRVLQPSQSRDRQLADKEDTRAVETLVAEMGRAGQQVVIDTPGTASVPSRAAHRLADVLITPINDSFVDFDVLAQVNATNGSIERPSVYSREVWEARQWRAEQGLPPTDWVVMRNRISSLEARNQRRIRKSLDRLAQRLGFRVVLGFSERVIFRELFLNGLTLLDLAPSSKMVRFSLSHVAARQELRDLARAIGVVNAEDAAGTVAAAEKARAQA